MKAVVAYSQTLAYVFSNFVTSSFFIYRLDVIMAAQLVIILPIMLGHLLGSSVIISVSAARAFSGATSEQSVLLKSIFRAFLLYNLVSNTIVSLLIARRIWRISRRIQVALGSGVAQTRATIIAMLLESGSAYPAAISIICLIALSAREDFLSTMLSDGAVFGTLTQIAGIVSTAASIPKSHGINIADIKIEGVESAVTEWSLSGHHFEQTINENNARRLPSPEVMMIAAPEQIEDLEAGKAH